MSFEHAGYNIVPFQFERVIIFGNSQIIPVFRHKKSRLRAYLLKKEFQNHDPKCNFIKSCIVNQRKNVGITFLSYMGPMNKFFPAKSMIRRFPIFFGPQSTFGIPHR